MKRVFNIVAIVVLSIMCMANDSFPIDYPVKPITINIPQPPGSVGDIIARTFASVAEKFLGQPVVAVNKEGAGGIVGMLAGARAAPDGYTLTVITSGQTYLIEWEIANGREVPFTRDDFYDFTPIGSFTRATPCVIVPYNSPWKTMSDLLRDCRAKPGQYACGTGPMYGFVHISAEILMKAAGINARIVSFKGGGPSITALVGGHVDFSLEYPGQAVPLARGNKLRILATIAGKRINSIPDIPAVKEFGINAERSQLVILLVPKKTAMPIVEKLRETLAKVVKDKSFTDAIASLGEELYHIDGNELGKYLKNQSEETAKIMAELAKAAPKK